VRVCSTLQLRAPALCTVPVYEHHRNLLPKQLGVFFSQACVKRIPREVELAGMAAAVALVSPFLGQCASCAHLAMLPTAPS
jgi:hypothetical protein